MKKLLTMLTVLAICATAHAAAGKPNIIVIFNDDMGYADVGCFGSEKNNGIKGLSLTCPSNYAIIS